ncbi:hypothetical protein ACV1DN_09480 [Aeromonas allosaccharophila]
MDDRQALAHEILQAALAECVAPRQDHIENDLAMVQGAPAHDHIAHVRNMVPEGWQLVPIKPTPEMVLHKSGCQHHAHDDMTCAARRTRELVWGHMLAAAPTPDHFPDAEKLAVLLADLRRHLGPFPSTMKEYYHGSSLLDVIDAVLTQLGGCQCPRCQEWWIDDTTAEFIGWHGHCGQCELDDMRTQEDTP